MKHLILICAMILHWMSMEKNQATINCFGLIVGGALGNVADRVRIKAVVDFLDFHIGSYHWPNFNIADACLVCGVELMFIRVIFMPPARSGEDADARDTGTAG